MTAMDVSTTLDFARKVLHAEADALRAAADLLDEHFERAAELCSACADAHGTVLVSGLGKSGLVGAKIAATLSSLGVPAHHVHPTEAAHGDLGRFRKQDVAICLSHSGETEEVVQLASILRQDGLPIISITKSREGSTLAKLSDCVLADGVKEEASAAAGVSSLLAPSSSTTSAMAIGDALALAIAHSRDFTNDDFARRHPGGQLGGLLRPVVELLRFKVGKQMPTVTPDQTVAQAFATTVTPGRKPGALLVVDEHGVLAGLFTDGDLRRLVARNPSDIDRPIGEVMTPSPRTLPSTALARDAVHLVREIRADEIPVVDEQGKPVGILDVQDLVTMKLVAE
ncbi:MAG: KpsF/GutQ family sugar-phosphate isomerase [Planctomycetota bacterium]